MEPRVIIEHLRASLPGRLAIHAFGSRVAGTQGPTSDLDRAVPLSGHADPVRLFELGADPAGLPGIEVDLIDLRDASTVMQAAVLRHGVRGWAADLG